MKKLFGDTFNDRENKMYSKSKKRDFNVPDIEFYNDNQLQFEVAKNYSKYVQSLSS